MALILDLRLNPMHNILNSIFSTPVNCPLRPALMAITLTSPCLSISPEVGDNDPPIILLNVDLPDPLMPTNPMTSPSWAVSETLSKAKKVLFLF